MANILARQRTIIGTTAEWAADDIIIGNGEIACEVQATEVKLKVGDGARKFSALPYVSGSGLTIPANIQAALNLKYDKAGGPLSGQVVVPAQANPAPLNLITRQWAEANISGQFATPMEVAALTITDKSVSPGTLLNAAVSPTAGAPDANKLVKTDTAGKVDPSFIYSTDVSTGAANSGDLVALGAAGKLDNSLIDGVDISTGAGDAGKVTLLDSTGKIHPSLLTLTGALVIRGSADPTQTAAPTGAVSGDAYVATNDGIAQSSWQGISGDPISAGDLVFFDGTNWHATSTTADLNNFLLKSGGTMTGPIAMGGDKITTLADATDDGDAVNFKQMKDADILLNNRLNLTGKPRIFTTSSTYTKPIGLVSIYVEVQAGGGGGGGASGTSVGCSSGGGGGGGGY